jgi:hypothetical protein
MPSTTSQLPMHSPTSILVGPNVWIRNPRRTRAMAAGIAFLSLCFLCIVFIPNCPPAHKTFAEYLRLGVFGFGVGALGLTLARRTAIAGLRIGPSEIVVRGPLKTRQVPLAGVAGFAPGSTTGPLNGGLSCPVLKTTDDESVAVWALGKELFVPRFGEDMRTLQPLCDDLNALLASLGSSEPPPSPYRDTKELNL